MLAKRYIFQASTQNEQQQRYNQLFRAGMGEHTIGLTSSNPLSYLRERCLSVKVPSTATVSALAKATSKHIWDAVFDQFYRHWFATQHPSFIAPEPHSLFPCYINYPCCPEKTLPLYLTTLPPSEASTIARLRFNRSRLNQSLFKRHRSDTDKCPTCPNVIETVEHVLMACPRYDKQRFECFYSLSAIANKPLLSHVFPLPFLLCSFPPATANPQQLIHAISNFLRSVRRIRDM